MPEGLRQDQTGGPGQAQGHAQFYAGPQPSAGYPVRAAVDDWLEHGLSGRSARTVQLYRDGVRPLTERLGDVRLALAALSGHMSTRSLQIAQNRLVRAICLRRWQTISLAGMSPRWSGHRPAREEAVEGPPARIPPPARPPCPALAAVPGTGSGGAGGGSTTPGSGGTAVGSCGVPGFCAVLVPGPRTVPFGCAPALAACPLFPALHPASTAAAKIGANSVLMKNFALTGLERSARIHAFALGHPSRRDRSPSCCRHDKVPGTPLTAWSATGTSAPSGRKSRPSARTPQTGACAAATRVPGGRTSDTELVAERGPPRPRAPISSAVPGPKSTIPSCWRVTLGW